jgi:hypothetical protein
MGTRWTTIPPWLYQSDLPDAELQEVYVKAARLKVLQLQAERDAERPWSTPWRDADRMLQQALAFLEAAEDALSRYREEAPAYRADLPARAAVKELPKPTG